MFTSNNTHSQASSASPYENELAQPQQTELTQALELTEQELEQVSGGIASIGDDGRLDVGEKRGFSFRDLFGF